MLVQSSTAESDLSACHAFVAVGRSVNMSAVDFSIVSESTHFLNSSIFYDYIKENCPANISNEQIKSAWNSMLLDLPFYRIEFLEKLNKDYKLYLLSNTNEVHISEFQKIIDNEIGYDRFKSVFNSCYYSSEICLENPMKHVLSMF